MSTVLVIGDTHIPFVHPNYLRFVAEVGLEHKVDRVIQIGDLVDNYALSKFVSDPDGMSSGNEWRATLEELKRWAKVFPTVDWIIGNHDKRPFTKAFEAQIPEAFLKPLEEIYELPEGWKVHTSLEVDGVRYIHGESAGGQQSWQTYCLKNGQSTVTGHTHSVGGVRYHRTPTGQIFSAMTGCGVDEETYALAYAKAQPLRPMLGCVVVKDGVKAEFIPMDMSDRRNYRKRRQVL